MARSTTRKRKRISVHPSRKSSKHTSGERKRSRGNRTRSRRRSSRRNRANYHTKYIKKQSKKRARAKGVGTEDKYNVDTSNWGQIQARRRADEKARQDKKLGEVLDLLSTRQGIHATSQSGPAVLKKERSKRPLSKEDEEKIKDKLFENLEGMNNTKFATEAEDIKSYNKYRKNVIDNQKKLGLLIDQDIVDMYTTIVDERLNYLERRRGREIIPKSKWSYV